VVDFPHNQLEKFARMKAGFVVLAAKRRSAMGGARIFYNSIPGEWVQIYRE
jgi:hypothetical protein